METRSRNQLRFASHILMVRPAAFGFNDQTAESNAFQHKNTRLAPEEIQARAASEFDTFVGILKEAEVEVTVIDDTPAPRKPDAIFPNNWISFHPQKTICLYPMLAPNRQAEVREDIVAQFSGSSTEVIDFRNYAAPEQYLEGTGSMILDRAEKVVYACISPRTNPALLNKFCEVLGYRAVIFHATDENGQEIYHTNVLMGLGAGFSLICLDAIRSVAEKEMVIGELLSGGFEVIPLSFDQINQFAGNMLQIKNRSGQWITVLSRRAWFSLSETQMEKISLYSQVLVIPLDVIETFGGGSVRCMMAEVF
ncbi:MAG: arginine deiminase-related protein [Bacteroidia bacterium]